MSAILVAALTGYAALDAVDVVPGVLTSDLSLTAAPDAGSDGAPPPANPADRGGDDTEAVDVSPALAPAAGTGPVPETHTLAAALAPKVADPALGPSVGAEVRDGATGEVLYAADAERARTPASSTKILTAAAVATTSEVHARWRTRAVAGAGANDVVLVAGGDNLLAPGAGDPGTVAGRAGLGDLADEVVAGLDRREGGRPAAVRVVLDDTYAKGAPLAPGWAPTDVSTGLTGPVAMLGLASDRAVPGRAASTDPALTAANAFRAELVRRGVAVSGAPVRGAAPAGAAELGAVESAPAGEVLALALDESDNDLTESVARWACVNHGVPATFDGCAAWVQQQVVALGVPAAGIRLADTSGLSRGTTIPASRLAQVVALASTGQQPQLRDIVARLPVAGLTGTLFDRYLRGPERPAAGLVRAKTGTLTGVGSLTGSVVDADGRLLVFSVVADKVPPQGTLAARAALDRLAATLAGCGCRPPGASTS